MLSISAPVSAFSLQGTTWERVGAEFGLDSYLLYAVALVESAKMSGSNKARPFPLALHTPDGAMYPKDIIEAANLVNHYAAGNPKGIDVGVMQVNAGWHGQRVEAITHLLDMETNIRVGAEILSETLRSSPDNIVIGVGRYHNWNDDRALAYGTRVMSVWSRLVILSESRGAGNEY